MFRSSVLVVLASATVAAAPPSLRAQAAEAASVPSFGRIYAVTAAGSLLGIGLGTAMARGVRGDGELLSTRPIEGAIVLLAAWMGVSAGASHAVAGARPGRPGSDVFGPAAGATVLAILVYQGLRPPLEETTDHPVHGRAAAYALAGLAQAVIPALAARSWARGDGDGSPRVRTSVGPAGGVGVEVTLPWSPGRPRSP